MSSNLDDGVDSSDSSYVRLCSLVGSSALFFLKNKNFSWFPLNSKEVNTKCANYMYSDSRAKHVKEICLFFTILEF